ncbi:MAG TPA: enoyl-CoA hydratase/isomerase family protein, partial [Xanthomonadales bacterium]|nr:enoyl-CoA hydratase/isomerase family protein [Xanthomonadales bacterium]
MKNIVLEINDSVAMVKLNRPKQMNALNPEACAELLEAVRSVEADRSVRCMIFTAEGKHFAGGADIDDFVRYLEDPDAHLGSIFESNVVRDANQFCQAVTRMPIPVISSLRG